MCRPADRCLYQHPQHLPEQCHRPNVSQGNHHHTRPEEVSCLNDYRPVALTPIIVKCFERLVMRHIKSLLPPSLDPLQFAYRPNRSAVDAISTTLHLALTHLDYRDTYVRMLFIDFSSAFNKSFLST
ncbi:hypothetical protein NFI96_004961 [Prochilodus magdalenae]|nr:hypothetical protein NFI96_004961 [Prochilodus magdalenae]